MWAGVWFLSALAGAVALDRDENGPWCQRVRQGNSSLIASCDVHSESELSLQETGEIGRYRARLQVPENHCRVQKLRITLYRYDLNQSQCSGQIDQTKGLVHSQQDFECSSDEVLTSEDLNDIPLPRTLCEELPPCKEDIAFVYLIERQNKTNPIMSMKRKHELIGGGSVCMGPVFVMPEALKRALYHSEINLTYYLDMVYGGCYLISYLVTYNDKFTATPRTQVVWIQSNHTEMDFEYLLNQTKYVSDIIGPLDAIRLVFQYRVRDYVVIFYNNGFEDNITYGCTPEYRNVGTELVCKTADMENVGNYSIRYNARAGWCNGQEAFQKYCFNVVNFQVVERQGDHPPPTPIKDYTKDLVTIAAVGISCLAVLFLILVIYYRFTKRNILCEREKEFLHKNFNYMNVKEAKVDPCLDELRGIVLVYARDCEPFMDAMLLLKRLLEERCAVKVYDIFDMDLLNSEISTSPHEWAASMLKEPGIKVVVVKTPCGELLYDPTVIGDRMLGLHLCEAALPTSVQYREPRFTDTLVHLLFRLVKDDAVLPGSYLKYFVVQISNFSGKKQLPQVNPYQRYELPAAAHLLVSDLLSSGRGRDRSFGAPEERLRAAVQRLRDYVDSNPNYMLAQLLHVVS